MQGNGIFFRQLLLQILVFACIHYFHFWLHYVLRFLLHRLLNLLVRTQSPFVLRAVLINCLKCFCCPPVVANQSPLAVEGASIPRKTGETTDMFEREEGELSKENGQRQSNGVELQTNVVDDRPRNSSRFTFNSSVIIHLYDCFQIWYLCKSWSAGAAALLLKGLLARA